MYTIKSKCVELPEMEYEDGASTLFLYTKGTKGIPDPASQQMLHYMEEINIWYFDDIVPRHLARAIERGYRSRGGYFSSV